MIRAILENLDLIVYGIVIAGSIYAYIRRRIGYANRSGPLLAATGLLAAGNLAPLHKGTIEGYDYGVIAGQNQKLMILVYLHLNTGLHLVGVGAKSGLWSQLRKRTLRKRLTKIDLEGDFPNYFAMYCTPGREVELLHLFDPADMAYFADFCQAYDFELHDKMIYMSQAGEAKDQSDKTWLHTDVERFIKHNKRFFEKIGV